MDEGGGGAQDAAALAQSLAQAQSDNGKLLEKMRALLQRYKDLQKVVQDLQVKRLLLLLL